MDVKQGGVEGKLFFLLAKKNNNSKSKEIVEYQLGTTFECNVLSVAFMYDNKNMQWSHPCRKSFNNAIEILTNGQDDIWFLIGKKYL